MDFAKAKQAQRNRLIMPLALAVVGMIVVALWFTALDALNGDDAPAQPAAAVTSGEPADGACPDIEATTPACLVRREALDLWAKAQEVDDRLAAKTATIWASAALSAARQKFEEAKQDFGAGRFVDSRDLLGDVMTALTAIEAEGEQLFETSLTEGWAGLDAERATESLAAFDRALMIHPDDADAATGRHRASVLPRLLDAFNAGREAMSAGRLDDAATHFTTARELDSANEKVAAALAELRTTVADRDFRAAMSRGLAGIETGDGEAAVDAFGRALVIRPSSPEARDGRTRAMALVERSTVGTLVAAADRALKADKWENAVAAYRQALTVDSSAETAIAGQRQATELLDLEAELVGLTNKPERLASAAVSQHARDVVARASRVVPTYERLQKQIIALQGALASMQKPVSIKLVSDGRTDISILRGGQFGLLTEKTIVIAPGRHIIIGTRKGYRDVRIEIEIAPDAAGSTVSVICNEPI